MAQGQGREACITGALRDAHTAAARRVLATIHGPTIASDLLFLETWEMEPTADIGATPRVGWIRQTSPGFAAKVCAKLTCGHARTACKAPADFRMQSSSPGRSWP